MRKTFFFQVNRRISNIYHVVKLSDICFGREREGRKLLTLLNLEHVQLSISIFFFYIGTTIRAVAGQRSSPDLCFATKLIKIYDQGH